MKTTALINDEPRVAVHEHARVHLDVENIVTRVSLRSFAFGMVVTSARLRVNDQLRATFALLGAHDPRVMVRVHRQRVHGVIREKLTLRMLLPDLSECTTTLDGDTEAALGRLARARPRNGVMRLFIRHATRDVGFLDAVRRMHALTVGKFAELDAVNERSAIVDALAAHRPGLDQLRGEAFVRAVTCALRDTSVPMKAYRRANAVLKRCAKLVHRRRLTVAELLDTCVVNAHG